MLSNGYFLAKFRFDTADNEPAKNLLKIAKFANFADPNPLTLTLTSLRRKLRSVTTQRPRLAAGRGARSRQVVQNLLQYTHTTFQALNPLVHFGVHALFFSSF